MSVLSDQKFWEYSDKAGSFSSRVQDKDKAGSFSSRVQDKDKAGSFSSHVHDKDEDPNSNLGPGTDSDQRMFNDTDSDVETMKENQFKLFSETEITFSSQLENSSKSSIFMTEFSSDNDSYSAYYNLDKRESGKETRLGEKRSRNRTIDLHDLPSLFWAGTVRGYYAKYAFRIDIRDYTVYRYLIIYQRLYSL